MVPLGGGCTKGMVPLGGGCTKGMGLLCHKGSCIVELGHYGMIMTRGWSH